MLNMEDLFVMDLDALHEDLYRMGNASSPKFTEARALIDCKIVERYGIRVVVANGNGFSAFNAITPAMKVQPRNVWRIRKGSQLPLEIRLVQDLRRPGHYMLAPAHDMPLKKFLGLLEEMAANPLIAMKLTPEEVAHAR